MLPVTEVIELAVTVLKNPNVADTVLAFALPNTAAEAVKELTPNVLANPTNAVRELTPRVLAFATPRLAVVALNVRAVRELTPSVLAFATPRLAAVAPMDRAVRELTPSVLAFAAPRMAVVARRLLTPILLVFTTLAKRLEAVIELAVSVLNAPCLDTILSD
jgi:hypothetical protein